MLKLFKVVIILLSSYNASALQCRVETSAQDYPALVAIDVSFTASCDEGVHLAQACGFTGARDSIFTRVAQEKCEVDFLTQLTDVQKLKYESRQDDCNEKFKNNSDSLAFSQLAFCRLEVSRCYSKHYRK